MNIRIGALLILILLVCTSCRFSSDNYKAYESQDFLMGTVISQKIYGGDAKRASEDIVKRLRDIESKMTVNTSGGEINNLNEQAGRNYVDLSEETIYILEKALKYSKLSNGAFDITIGPLVKEWGIFTENPRVPLEKEIGYLLRLVDYNSLIVNKNLLTAKLIKAGQAVDLGGIAKGYGADEAIKIYKSYGIKSAYINLGGNIAVLGTKPDGTPWKIGIQNPRAENGKYIGLVSVIDKAVVTSGDYERYFEKDGIRYHHILDPKTGYPAQSDLISATIVAGKSVDADALSTAVFILGLDKGMELVNSLEDVDAVFVTSERKVYITNGLKDVFTFTDESRKFEYIEKR